MGTVLVYCYTTCEIIVKLSHTGCPLHSIPNKKLFVCKHFITSMSNFGKSWALLILLTIIYFLLFYF